MQLLQSYFVQDFVIAYLCLFGGFLMMIKKHITIFTGHFGSGKTELALNSALQNKNDSNHIALADLDVINPYYRSRDLSDQLFQKGIKLIAPSDELRTSDLPIVSGDIYRYIHDPSYELIVDAGGDKDGATALGQYYNEWKDKETDVYFVLNANRPYVSTVEGVINTIEHIEIASRMKITGLINNTNVGSETTLEHIKHGVKLSELVCQTLNIPFICSTISRQIVDDPDTFSTLTNTVYIDRLLKLPWDV